MKLNLQKRKISMDLTMWGKSIEEDRDRCKVQYDKLLQKMVKLDARFKMTNKEKDRLKIRVIRLSN